MTAYTKKNKQTTKAEVQQTAAITSDGELVARREA